MNSLHKSKFDDAYNQFYPKILQYCYYKLNRDMSVAEEITQEVFLALYLSWDKLRSHSDVVIFSWLQKTSRNIMSKYFRQLKKNCETISYDEYLSQNSEIGTTDTALNIDKPRYTYEEYIEEIRKILSPEEFKLFTYVFIEELTFIQTATLLDVNLNTVKSRVRRLKSKLKSFISNLFK